MSDCESPTIGVFGSGDVIPLWNDEIINVMGGPPLCEATLRDQFACCALEALGADNNYALTRTPEGRLQSVKDAYAIADLMIAERLA